MPDFQNKPDNIRFGDGEESENGLQNVMRSTKPCGATHSRAGSVA